MTKRIAVVVSAMNLGGAQTVVSILSSRWADLGHNVTIICTFSGEKDLHYKINNRINLIYLDQDADFAKRKWLNLFSKLIKLRKAIKKNEPDIVVSFLTRVNIASAAAMLGTRIPLIICERSWPPFLRLNKKRFWFYRMLLRGVSCIVVQTEKSKDWLRLRCPMMNACVIPNPVQDTVEGSAYRSLSPESVLRPTRKVILASGRLHEVKQFDILVRAFSLIATDYPECDLVILGEGEEREILEKLCGELKLNERIFLPGPVGNVTDWYQRADIFVLSSQLEGFPNVLLEAMSQGLPCISFDCDTGPREMIINGHNGILVDPEKKEAGLEVALVQLLNDHDLRNSIAKNALSVRTTFSVDSVINKWNLLLHS